jgi:L-fuconolactonase
VSRVIVDAHHHLWDPARAIYPWMAGLGPTIERRYGPEDLAPLLAATDVERTLLVQTRASIDETREFLATAAGSEFIDGVIGWIDLTDRGAGEMLDALRAGAGGERLVGIRHQVHDEPDPEWLLRRDVRRGLRAVADAGLPFDLLVRPRELPAALATAEAMPELRFVIDHLGKPPIRAGELEPWASLIAPFGSLDNAWCKLSGLVTEADPERWSVADLQPFVEHALDVFGAGRLIFGSDWPVCLLAASYDEVIGAARSVTAQVSESERGRLFGATATRVYGLDRGR